MAEASTPARRTRLTCAIIAPRGVEYEDLRRSILSAARDSNIRVVARDEVLPLQPETTAMSDLQQADLVVAVLSQSQSQNVYYEIGLTQAIGKPIVLLVDEEVRPPDFFLRSDQTKISYDKSTAGLRRLQLSLRKFFEDVVRNPRRFRSISQLAVRSTLPEIDFETLHPRDLENLCFELLTQMGYRRVEWGKHLDEIDVVASLPKKDPDGFEYSELWLISMGLRTASEKLLTMALHDPDFLLTRLRRQGLRDIEATQDTPVTLLFIFVRGDSSAEILEDQFRRLERRQADSRTARALRVRVWDRRQLVSLIRQHPQIAFKYFGEEQRNRSPSRKSYEELYLEYSALAEQYARTIATLENEKGRRVKAERDAVWKDVAFTAAHKLGNPVFALETNLLGLKRKIKDQASGAKEITDEMNISIEKAKTIIEQFKSLTKANNISKRSIDLLPIIETAAQVATANGVKVDIASEIKNRSIEADPVRMAECFDELFANALHWLQKPDKQIRIRLELSQKDDLPVTLDVTKKYVRIRFEDNGEGIPTEKKDEIFAPFYSTYPHGTGLGLALVQRLIEAHGGAIREVGATGQGANFEIFLPQAAGK
ncbi:MULTISPECIES: HAMP domain-containing sensor histidine kinase [unclassified Bradyrhizobium]|uniref:sensor histidine kinase n=1 Tax=unclassified Bradyrhizobium TaxID=2631580 RepID=UPI001BAA91D8|nr:MULTISPECIES: HAMP domain-containing sensor histidine kinase [unclassified Bradyrhizobium]MBR1201511.1 HAMP domain-containing histidine kinase [Bradyrhizobium sp. AUGA SZCCT0124]MBR1310667.1 HAMP domain-containing histidine kinase [Bradyrhizobium sp. AUGA SZCCT0051]MBR1340810.1 HAMP domain-containing histidine kinase [Bradyrhizobium sp. AUGA SZCCT0105]MBR1355416.1 HAMP domain-containing histidine kinase [Bradyrhizobium sp. AUGA SZCCT0045]